MAGVGCVTEADLHALLVGELPEPVARAIALHLESCPACEAIAQRLDGVTDQFISGLRQAVHCDSGNGSTAQTIPELGGEKADIGTSQTGHSSCSVPVPLLQQGLAGYTVLEELGRGGMSVVYRARQSRPERVVALKLLLSGSHASTERRLRFLAEGDAIARLQHPGIVAVYEVGEHNGMPFQALEYMGGGSLAQRLTGQPMSARQAAELLETLARAVEHAHAHGVIHRDLKPANVLYTEDGQPKISDFGLAKQERPELTAAGDVLGTPSYMAPEQARGSIHLVGPAADIYALGGMLYEFLTGRPPFLGASVLETLDQVRNREPVPPGRLRAHTPRDLQTICLKCLEKEPARRYASAGALAEDLRRFLNGRPVLARPVGPLGRVWRWARRNPGWAAMLGSVAGLLLVIAVGASALSVWALRAEAQTEEKLFESRLSEARAKSMSQHAGRRFASLALLEEAGQLARRLRLPSERLDDLRNATIAALALPDLYPHRTWEACRDGFSNVDFDDRLAVYARADRQGNCSIRRVADDFELHFLPGAGQTSRQCLPFLSRDARFVAVVDHDGRLRLWRLDGAQPELLLSDMEVSSVDFHPTHPQVAFAHNDGAISVHDLTSGRQTRLVPDGPTREVVIALHPTEPLVAVGSYFSKVVKIRDLHTGKVIKDLPMAWNGYFVAWHPQGHTLAVSDSDSIHLFDRATFERRRSFAAPGSGARLFFNHAGDRLAVYCWGKKVALYDAVSGDRLFQHPFTEATHALHFDRDDRLLAGFFEGSRLGVWQVGDGRECRTLVHQPVPELSGSPCAAVSPDGRLLAVLMKEGIGFWDLNAGRQIGLLRLNRPRFVRFEPGPHPALLIGDESITYRWPIHVDSAERPAPLRKRGDHRGYLIGPPQALALPAGSWTSRSQDGRVLATSFRAVADFEPWAGAWILHADQPDSLMHLAAGADLWSIAVSPDGRWVATADRSTVALRLWDARTGHCEHTVRGIDPEFSPDGQWLAVGGEAGRLLRVGTWDEGPGLGNTGRFAPDGKMLIVWTNTSALRLVETATSRELARLEGPRPELADHVFFSPDGTRLFTISYSEGIHVWDLRLLRSELAQRGLDWDAPPYGPATASTEPIQLQFVRGDYDRQHAGLLAQNFVRAVGAAPHIAKRWWHRGIYRQKSRLYEQALTDLRKAVELEPGQPKLVNALARLLGTGPEKIRNSREALELAERAVALQPGEWTYQNTLGIAYYRAGRFADAVAALEKSLQGGAGQSDAFDLYFLAMAHHRLGHTAASRTCFSRAAAWHRAQKDLPAEQTSELEAFRVEAAALLGLADQSVQRDTPLAPESRHTQ